MPEDLSWMSRPLEEGEFETGCHTHQGNDLILFAQTTRELHDRRYTIFGTVYGRHRTEPDFDWVEALRAPIKELFRETTRKYRREVREDPGGDVYTYPDFFNCCIRDYLRWIEDYGHDAGPAPAGHEHPRLRHAC